MDTKRPLNSDEQDLLSKCDSGTPLVIALGLRDEWGADRTHFQDHFAFCLRNWTGGQEDIDYQRLAGMIYDQLEDHHARTTARSPN